MLSIPAVVSIFCTRRRVRVDCGSVAVSDAVTSEIEILSLFIFVQRSGDAGIVFSIEGTFSMRVSIPNALNIDSLSRSINLSVVFVMSVTTIKTPLMATIHTANLATCMMASTTISTSLSIHSRQSLIKPRNLSKFDSMTGVLSSECVVRNIGCIWRMIASFSF